MLNALLKRVILLLRSAAVPANSSEAGRQAPGKFACVDIKADKRLADMALVKYSRPLVQPVTSEDWKIVCNMGGMSLTSS